MPVYFFHLHDGGDIVDDEEGIASPDIEEARDHAIGSARDIMASDVLQGRLDLSDFIIIANASGVLAADTYREALSLSGLQST